MANPADSETIFRAATPTLLAWGHGKVTAPVASHSHAFFQIEICAAGTLCCREPGGGFTVAPGGAWIIPPGTAHGFEPGEDPADFYSLKVIFADFPVVPQEDEATRFCIRSLIDLLQQLPDGAILTGGKRRLAEGLIFELFRSSRLPAAGDAGELAWPYKELVEAVLREGCRVNVEYLAELLHLNRAQLKYRFRKADRFGLPLKTTLAVVLQVAAEEYLRYSDKNLTGIAAALHFGDLYAFSRFFRRMTGLPPGTYRKKFRAAPPPEPALLYERILAALNRCAVRRGAAQRKSCKKA